jgi:hypothetical protein
MLDGCWPTLEALVQEYEPGPDVRAALLYGSFADGTATGSSDLDLLFLTDGSVARPPILEVRDGLLVEAFFVDPPTVRRFFEIHRAQHTHVSAVQWAAGQILFDKDGTAAELRVEAEQWLATKSFDRTPVDQLYWTTRALWQSMRHVEQLAARHDPTAAFVCHQHLRRLYETYAKFLGEPVVDPHKLHAYLSDGRTRATHRLAEFADASFAHGLLAAIREADQRELIRRSQRVTAHVLREMGGFDVPGWRADER